MADNFDFVTDQTAAHDPLTGYIPRGLSVEDASALRVSAPDDYLRRASESMPRILSPRTAARNISPVCTTTPR